MMVVALMFMLCGAGHEREDAPPDACESGITRAGSCAAAEAFLRAGLRPGQVLMVRGCVSNPPSLAQLWGAN